MYTPLDPTEHEIRLASILPGRWSDEVSCKLESVSLDDKPIYEALSYTWGDPSDKVAITLEGVDFSVTKNLHMALRRLRHAESTRRIWVDAFCINQSDSKVILTDSNVPVTITRKVSTNPVDEGNIFRRLRGPIYLGESRILETIPEEEQDTWADPPRSYWLGDNGDVPILNDHGTWQTLTDDQLSQLSQTTRLRQAISSAYTILELLAAGRCVRNFVLHNANPQVWAEALSVLHHVASSPWWTRVWVVEEVILPEKATTIYGEVVAPLDIIERGGSMINPHIERCCREFYRSLPEDHQAHLLAIAQHTAALEVLRHERFIYADSEANRLQIFLEMTRARGAYNARDKIYSLLGLTRDCSNRLAILPDYSLDVWQVYVDTAFKVIRNQNSREILLTAEKKDTESEIPTWCPDWSKNEDGEENDLWVHSRSWKFDAGPANGIVADLYHDRVLAVRGVYVDVIAETTLPLSQDEQLAARLDRFARIVGYDPEADVHYVGGGIVREAFWRTMLNNALETEPNKHRTLTAQDGTVFVWWWNNLRNRMTGTGQIYHPLQAHSRIIARSFWLPNDNRALFTTKRGYMGFGSPDMKQGDTVAVILGSRMPFILRQMPIPATIGESQQVKDKEYLSVVGYCYLHGVMQGKAVGEDAKVFGINLI
ncbi:hypothetical protein BO94DRAFT_583385 [Aspergillus sclerotioniger CBS 115572]|uniref:Heterokaryon incompatibility domain-containing protein n=1 Tax=Aspergillus sclerotioniger CBS 115572 TaxID=1450535 RepID=A0A317X471_9EURO|nr:hypothetical protein BO94DRAFT_583385 [Aspergillus sclerotioniger CBS 115572]PWY93145.1 hypothetical protein BO94DRAFT_583385 [Aspergillus sclerotioniger CBS 115572]